MDSERWEHVQALFHAALEREEPERLRRLVAECDGDAFLLADVLALLAEDARGGTLLDADRAEVARALLDAAPEPLRIGRYRVLRRLGEGGMGVVYLAEREDLRQRVAIKMLRDASLSPARRERFEREQQTLAGLEHPGIARLYDADTLPDGTPYFVMEYVPGAPLTAYCEARGCPLSERLRLFRDVCEAVQHAHRQAVIHRDLKPGNILVAEGRRTGDASVKLLDFGIAKHLESLDDAAAQTRTVLRMMTPAYAAPEQLRGGPVGVHTDVYALGVILYELLTGRHPFDASELTAEAADSAALGRSPVRPSRRERPVRDGRVGGVRAGALSAAAWEDLDVLCLTAMHEDPERRYASVEALLRDLGHYLRGEPLEARPDTLRYRTAKFVSRNRQPLAAAAMVGAVTVALVAFYTTELAEQRDRARAEAEKAAAVSEYLYSLFEAGDPFSPEEGLDVRALLERGRERAEQLAEQPHTQAQMLHVLGRVHTQLSDYPRAEELLRRAIALRRDDGDPRDLAGTLVDLGVLFVHTAAYDSAESVLREALNLQQRHLPANHPDLATTLDVLGVALSSRGDYAAADPVYRLSYRIRRAFYDRPHADLGYSLNNLAVNLYRQGEYAAAETHYRMALEVERAVYGGDHPNIATGLANLGMLYNELGNHAAADSLLTEALRIRRATLGNEHFETAVGLSQLGSVLLARGRLDAAEAALRESLVIREALLDPSHPSIATVVNGLAGVLERRGEYEEAEALYRRALAVYRESLGERHRNTAVALANLADVLRQRGDLETAEAYMQEAVSILEEVHPENHQELAHNRGRMGAVLAALGKDAEAERLLLQAHRTLQAQLGAKHARTRQATERLAEFYESKGMAERATPYRRQLAAAPGG